MRSGPGIGVVAGNTFAGNTMQGLPFHTTATTTGFNGRVRVLIDNRGYDAAGNCDRIW